MSFESYKVAIHLSLVNGVTSGLIGITSQFKTLNDTINSSRRGVSQLERDLASLKKSALIGGAMVGVGAFGLSLFKAPLEAASEYEKAYSRFKQFSLGDAMNKEADKFARSTQVFGASSEDLMNALNMSMGVFGRDEKGMAYKVAPVLAQLNAANAGIFGGKVEGIESGAFRSINRFIDMKGLAGNYESYMHGLDLAQKIVSGSGGTIQFRDLEQFAKRGGTSFKSLSDDGLFNMMLAMQEMGGSTAGQSMMSLYQNLVAGRASKKAITALASLGLVDTHMMTAGQLGGDQFQTLETKSVIGADMARKDPMGWLRTYVLPKLAGMSQDEQFQVVNSLFSNRNASNLGALGVNQIMQVVRDANMGKGALGVEGTLENAKNNPANNFLELQKKWNSALTELGIAVLPQAIKMVKKLTSVIKEITQYANQHPIRTKVMLDAFAILSAATAAGGVVILATAAFRALGLAMAFNAVGGLGIFPKLISGFTLLGPLLARLVGGVMAMTAGTSVVTLASLTTFIASLPAVIMALAGAAAAGYAVGTVANKWISYGLSKATGHDTTLGSWLYDKIHGDDDARLISGIAPKRQQSVAPHSHDIVVDGQKLGQTTTKYITKDASKPTSGGTRFDPTSAPYTPQMNWAN